MIGDGMPSPIRWISLLLEPCRAKDIVAERNLQEAVNFLAESYRVGGLIEWDSRAACVEYLLHLGIFGGPLSHVDFFLRGFEELVGFLILPAAVQRADGGRIDEIGGDLVRIGDIVGPCRDPHRK